MKQEQLYNVESATLGMLDSALGATVAHRPQSESEARLTLVRALLRGHIESDAAPEVAEPLAAALAAVDPGAPSSADNLSRASVTQEEFERENAALRAARDSADKANAEPGIAAASVPLTLGLTILSKALGKYILTAVVKEIGGTAIGAIVGWAKKEMGISGTATEAHLVGMYTKIVAAINERADEDWVKFIRAHIAEFQLYWDQWEGTGKRVLSHLRGAERAAFAAYGKALEGGLASTMVLADACALVAMVRRAEYDYACANPGYWDEETLLRWPRFTLNPELLRLAGQIRSRRQQFLAWRLSRVSNVYQHMGHGSHNGPSLHLEFGGERVDNNCYLFPVAHTSCKIFKPSSECKLQPLRPSRRSCLGELYLGATFVDHENGFSPTIRFADGPSEIGHAWVHNPGQVSPPKGLHLDTCNVLRSQYLRLLKDALLATDLKDLIDTEALLAGLAARLKPPPRV